MDKTILDYANGNKKFARWLEVLDLLVLAKVQMGLFDLDDMNLYDSFSAGDTPEECLENVVAESVREEYGDELADLLFED